MRLTTLAAVAGALALTAPAPAATPGVSAQDATPATTYNCEDVPVAQVAGSAAGGMQHATAEMGAGTATAMAGVDHAAMEFDQLYIDMMIPHHGSIIAMSEAALTRLEDARLRQIAQRIIDTQSAEQEELRGYREDFYGDPEPMAMDDQMMAMMGEMMPGMGSMDEMAMQMEPQGQVAAICGAEDADVAFIDLTIPHHESAIAASEAALLQATHDEIRRFAERVIADQRREIDEVGGIRRDLIGSATPAAIGA